MTMPQNCTAFDLAYSIHTFLGNHCIGAKVNHKLVSMNHVLQSGDQVEILTSNSQHVQANWLTFATTAKARAKIQAALKREQRKIQKEGEEKLNAFLEKEQLANYANNIEKLWVHHNLADKEALLTAIGNGTIVLGEEDKEALLGNQKRRFSFFFFGKEEKKEEKREPQAQTFEEIDRKTPIHLTDDSLQKNYIIADCCHPIPGDDVLAYYDENKHIVIHKRQCPVADRLKSSHGDRILSAQWETHRIHEFVAHIIIQGTDRIGLINEITGITSQQMNVNIQKFEFENRNGVFECNVWLNVRDVNDVKQLCEKLKKVESVQSVARAD
jgi:GTP pyrophosphokinase